MNLNREQLLLIVLGIIILLVGSGIFFWQSRQNQQVVADLNDPVKISDAEEVATEEHDKKEEPEEPKTIIIHIAGAVRESGVYQLKEGARVIDALKLAGGEIAGADLDSINLAAPVYDGDKIYIPVKEDNKELEAGNLNPGNGKIPLNRASREDLQELSGIGPSKSESIVKYREKVNGFTEIEQLLDVSGIGEKTLAKIKDELRLR